MKENLRLWMAKVDALSLRERALIFVACIALLLSMLFYGVFLPLEAKQKGLAQQLKETQMKIVANGDEIAAKLRSINLDPDAVSRTRLHEVRSKISAMQNELRNQQKGLVPANKIAPLLQSLLKNHANVQLQALHTLKVEALSPANPAAASQAASAEASADPLANEKAMKDKIAAGQPAASSPAATVANSLGLASSSSVGASASANSTANAASAEVAPTPPTAQVYKHAVEIVLTGNYLDLLAVLQEMEKLPWQLYWAKASLRTEQHPQSTLTLHIFTLSLDQIWLDL